MNKKKLDKYNIKKYRYRELSAFCMQYQDWKEELENNVFFSAINYDGAKPSNHQTSDTTAKHAIRMLKLKRNCELIEKCAKEATAKTGGEIWRYIIKNVCFEVSYRYMKTYDEIPIERATFFSYKRYFFYLLDQDKD